ncbi:MAG: guanylate kinase [Sulfurospirillaceae bacterium]|nr:guanylate kinase [Sulfurospirillaceae bacterium]
MISGPSGSGKSSLMKELLARTPDSYFSISTTTRAIREGEVDGVNYHYITKEAFERDIEEGFFLEWANVHDNYYGTSLRPVTRELEQGKLVVFDIDVQGHAIAKEKFGDIITSVFITTPNLQTLRDRLEARNTDSREVIDKRLANATVEMKRIGEYSYLVINDDFQVALDGLMAIATSVRQKISLMDTKSFIDQWGL